MKQLILFLGTLLPTAIAAQELHTFSNGEVADAEKINENFQYVLENATNSGGCSAEQDGSNVVITCADGTSGVLASEGTVIVYPEGQTGAVDLDSFNTGDIVVKDANDVILAPVELTRGDKYEVSLGPDKTWPLAYIRNDNALERVELLGYGSSLFFTNPDCKGASLYTNRAALVRVNDEFFADAGQFLGDLLTKSRLDDGEECINLERVDRFHVFGEYTPAQELLEAAYPARLEQLP